MAAADCIYFLKSTCTRGSACKFRHNESVRRANLQNPVRPCIFFQKGYCSKGDECTYLHTTTNASGATADPKSTLCSFFAAGKCTNGLRCAYSHDMAAFKDSLEALMTISGTSGTQNVKSEPVKDLMMDDSPSSPGRSCDEDDRMFTLEYSEVTPSMSTSTSSQYSLKRRNEQDSVAETPSSKRLKVEKRNTLATPSSTNQTQSDSKTTRSRPLVVKRAHRLQIDRGEGSHGTGGSVAPSVTLIPRKTDNGNGRDESRNLSSMTTLNYVSTKFGTPGKANAAPPSTISVTKAAASATSGVPKSTSPSKTTTANATKNVQKSTTPSVENARDRGLDQASKEHRRKLLEEARKAMATQNNAPAAPTSKDATAPAPKKTVAAKPTAERKAAEPKRAAPAIEKPSQAVQPTAATVGREDAMISTTGPEIATAKKAVAKTQVAETKITKAAAGAATTAMTQKTTKTTKKDAAKSKSKTASTTTTTKSSAAPVTAEEKKDIGVKAPATASRTASDTTRQAENPKTSENKTTTAAAANASKPVSKVSTSLETSDVSKSAVAPESKESNVDDIMQELNALFSGDYVPDDTDVDISEFADILEEVDNTLFSG